MKKVLVVVILVLAVTAAVPTFHPLSLKAADTIPAQYTDAEFWSIINESRNREVRSSTRTLFPMRFRTWTFFPISRAS